MYEHLKNPAADFHEKLLEVRKELDKIRKNWHLQRMEKTFPAKTIMSTKVEFYPAKVNAVEWDFVSIRTAFFEDRKD